MDDVFRKRLALCPNLPSLPGVAMRVIELGRDPDVGIADITQVVSMDPALAAKLLKIANSPMYAQRRRVDNLRQALMLLGLNAAMTLALSFSLVGSLAGGPASGMDYPRYWRRSLITALASRVIGKSMGLRRLEELFLAGLLQDIGMSVLDVALRGEYAAVLAQGTQHDALVRAEAGAFGADHAEVGAWIMEQWGMPDYLQAAARNSHATERSAVVCGDDGDDDDDATFCACVALASWLAEMWVVESRDEITARIGCHAKALLGLEAERLHEIIDEVGTLMPEASSVFEIELVDSMRVAAVLDHAREVLMVRNLQIIHEAAEARVQAERMEERARVAEERSRRDALTGAYNRAFLEDSLAREFELATERGWPLSIAFIDLDHFKRINDTWGHQAGDEILRRVVEWLTRFVRKGDIVARYGGEEFVLVLPGARQSAACAMMDRLRSTIAAQPHELDDGQKVTVTISAGIATHMENGVACVDVSYLVRNADRAVYTAKRNGRNRVEVYSADA